MNKGTAIVGFILSFIAGMILVWGIGRGTGAMATRDEAGAAAGATSANPGAVKVDLFVMSQCPYGVQAEALFDDVVKKMGADIDFNIEYIGKKGPNGDMTSMHGPNEVKGNIVQLCAKKHFPAKYLDLIACQNKTVKEVASNWDACAKDLGLDAGKIGQCADGDEGKQLLSASFDKATAAQASGSPTILINGVKYQGQRKSGDIIKAICKEYKGNAPAICGNIPESPKVNVTILADKRCTEKECDTKRVEGTLKQKVGNPVITMLDYADPAGKKLYDSLKPVNLPVAIFDSTLDADKDAATQLGRNLKPKADKKVMETGSWNPMCQDDGGCDLAECKNGLFCRKEEPATLEVFVMSQCPFGVKFLDAMKEVSENFKKNDVAFKFKVNFIGSGDAKTLNSMHGPGEVEEDIRELCAVTYYPDDQKYMNYILCRNKNIKDGANWQSCTGGDTGIDTETIKKCSEGDEGKDLLAKNFEYSSQSGMRGSPSWIVNNKFKFGGYDAETIKNGFCQHNKVAGCDTKLSGPPPAPAGKQQAQPGGCGG